MADTVLQIDDVYETMDVDKLIPGFDGMITEMTDKLSKGESPEAVAAYAQRWMQNNIKYMEDKQNGN